MSVRLTKERIKEKVKELGFEYVENELEIGYDKPVDIIDKDGYKYRIMWSELSKNSNKFKPITYSNIYSIENIKRYLNLNKINLEIISTEFKTVSDPLRFKCPICENIFEFPWCRIKTRKYLMCDKCMEKNKITRKLNEDEVFLFFKSKGYTPIDGEKYIGNSIGIKCKDEDGFMYIVRRDNLDLGKIPSKILKTNPYSIYNINLSLELCGSKTRCISTKYINEDHFLKFICGDCGKIFKSKSCTVLSTFNKVCYKCARIKVGKKRRLNIENVEKEFLEFGYTLLDKEYTRNSEKLLCIDKYGYKGYLSYGGLQRIKRGKSNKFDYFSESYNLDNVIYNLNNFCKLNNIKSEPIEYLLDDNSFSKPTIKVKCSCGDYFYTTKSSFTTSKRYCDKCNKKISTYEQKVIDWLKENNIKYQRQKRFKECKNYLPLPFDFYIKDLSILIEVDGEGHYFPCNFNKCSDESAIKSFENTRINDSIKTGFCKKNNIELIRIPYWEFNKDNNYIKILNQSIFKVAT